MTPGRQGKKRYPAATLRGNVRERGPASRKVQDALLQREGSARAWVRRPTKVGQHLRTLEITARQCLPAGPGLATGEARERPVAGAERGSPRRRAPGAYFADASSSSMTFLKASKGCAPDTRRPLMMKPGVPRTPTELPSAICASTA